MGGPTVPAPPVVDERAGPCRRLAAGDVLRGEAAQPPRVLQFVETVFAVAAIPVQLGDRLQRITDVGYQHRIFPHRVGIEHRIFGQRQPKLPVGIAALASQCAANAPAHNHNAPLRRPADELQMIFDYLAALCIGPAPVTATELSRNQPLNVLRLAQPQQVRLLSLLGFYQNAFVAIAAIATNYRRTPATQFVEHPAKPGLRMH